jgi:hypothetical protein
MKKILLPLIFLSLLGFAALGVLFFNASKVADHFSPQIKGYLGQTLNAKVFFDHIAVEFWPAPAVSLKGVRIEELAGADFSARSIDAGLAIWSLLRQKLEITSLTVFEPKLLFRGARSDVVSVDINETVLAGKDPKREQRDPQDQVEARSGRAFEVNLKRLRLVDGLLLIEDPKTQRQFLLENLQLATGLSLKGGRVLITTLDGSTRYNGIAWAFRLDDFEYSSAKNAIDLALFNLSSDLGEIRLRGKYFFDTRVGQVETLTGVVLLQQLERLLAGLGFKLPVTQLRGAVRPRIGLNYGEKTGLLIDGTLSVSDVGFQYQNQLLTGISGEVQIFGEKAAQHLFSSSGLKVGLGEGTGSVEVKGQVDQKLNGEIAVLSNTLKVEEILPLLNKYLPQAGELRLESGGVELAARISLGSGQVKILEATLPLRGISARPYNLPLANLNGNIEVRPAKDDFIISLGDLDAEIGVASERLTLRGKYQTGVASSGSFQVASERLSFANLAPLLDRFWPAWGDFNLEGAIRPDLEVAVARSMLVGANGSIVFDGAGLQAGGFDIKALSGVAKIRSLAGDGSLIESDKLEFVLKNQECTAALSLLFSGQQLQIKSLSARALSGEINGSATFGSFGRGASSLRLSLLEVDIESLLQLFAKSEIISGSIEEATVALSSERGLANVESWRGQLAALSKNALLKEVNLGRMVLERVDNVPYLSGRLLDEIPEQFHKYFSGRDTEIIHLAVTVIPAAGEFKLERLELLTDAYFVTARGMIDRQQQLGFDAEMVLNKEISNHLVRQVRELRSWQSGDQTIAIPFRLSGRFNNVKIRPDVSRLVQKGLVGKLEEILERTTRGRR